jgi:hypothetical protein
MKAFLAFALLLCGSFAFAEPPKHLDEWKEVSVLIDLSTCTGSGVAFKNGGQLFVHTDGHVIKSVEKIETVIDPKSGQKKVVVKYADVKVTREVYLNGRKVGERMAFAEVLRYSEPKRGDDYALLRVRDPNFVKMSATFADFIPKAGDEVWHVGSSYGVEGQNTVSKGVFSTAGRLRRGFDKQETDDPHLYDQVTLACLGGSSGAGIFDAKTGSCIGLVTEGLTGGTESINFITPVRRIRALAKKHNFEWAVDPKVAVPTDEEIFKTPIRMTDIPLPAEWKPPTLPPPLLPGFMPAIPGIGR